MTKPSPASASTAEQRSSWGAVLLFFCLLAICHQVIRPGLDGPFLLDDVAHIPATAIDTLSYPALKQQFLKGERLFGASRGIPRLSFALTGYFSGDTAHAFKYQNLLLHLINALLVFWLVLLLHDQVRTRTSRWPVMRIPAAWFALAVAGIWLLHPLQLSTVLYSVQRLVLLASLFMLLALLCYVKGRILARRNVVLGTLTMLLGVGFFGVLGLLSKEIAALLPLLIAAIEWFFFGLEAESRSERRALLGVLLVLVVVPLLVGLLMLIPKLPGLYGWHPGRGFSGAERLLTEFHVLALYLKLFFVPVAGTMSLFHDNFPIVHAADAATIGLAGIYVALIIAAFLLRKRAAWIGFGLVWFFTCHLLESTIFPLELVFEHRNYLAILGLSATLVAALGWLLSGSGLSRLRLPILACVLLILALNTALRAGDWGDMGRLLAADYRRDPQSPRVLWELVSYEKERGNRQRATLYLQRLIALDRPEAGAELVGMLFTCGGDEFPAGLYPRTLHKLETGLLSPFTTNALSLFVNQTLLGRCPAIDDLQLGALVDAAVNNPRPRTADQACIANEMRVRLLIEYANWDALTPALEQGLDRCARASPQTIQFFVENILRFAVCRDKLRPTEISFETVAAHARRAAILDRAYLGSGGFDLQEMLHAD
ncbi:MAG TPA: hypothetical protein DDY14_08885 [Chromatiaceae bacterium]|jgi:hypothetical protein|nr:MAG: hypothetical protein N838_24430 [Thiohalocapsa sp. PB-PSB1]QQO52245.1 MAG: hypothetical protein N838_01455 [Thiohalocapsa sp. PB-PSB1]HBG95420.1 hypothetical protein [Chromatiaceae bacterium]HCS89427.1 hypothetical protein [Chromatiaceae bacterium]